MINTDKVLLRELAFKYQQISFSDDNLKKISHHRDVNDLKSKVPVLLIDEIPWHEMNIDNSLTLRCEDEFCRNIEWFFKRQLMQAKYFPADTIYQPFFPVYKQVYFSGIGVERQEKENQGGTLSHTYINQLSTWDDLEKLHNQTITYDEAGTLKTFERVSELIGDIIPVKIYGMETGYNLGLKTMDDIIFMCGLDSFFFDLIERPDFMHAMIGKLTDIFIDTMRQIEEMNLLEANAFYCHSAAALSNDLPSVENGKVKLKNVWGRGLAQIFATVSPQMHEEFDIDYMIKALSPFGLVYYGCCEPLDKKIDIVSKIPNLRKISITPWADVVNACEQIGGKYVVSSKPNPSALARNHIDEATVYDEISKIGQAIKSNGCSADIILKDITTVNNNPFNLIAWHDTAKKALDDIFG